MKAGLFWVSGAVSRLWRGGAESIPIEHDEDWMLRVSFAWSMTVFAAGMIVADSFLAVCLLPVGYAAGCAVGSRAGRRLRRGERTPLLRILRFACVYGELRLCVAGTLWVANVLLLGALAQAHIEAMLVFSDPAVGKEEGMAAVMAASGAGLERIAFWRPFLEVVAVLGISACGVIDWAWIGSGAEKAGVGSWRFIRHAAAPDWPRNERRRRERLLGAGD